MLISLWQNVYILKQPGCEDETNVDPAYIPLFRYMPILLEKLSSSDLFILGFNNHFGVLSCLET